jgi:glycosyltransferase involved in cell wall biosynthesis
MTPLDATRVAAMIPAHDAPPTIELLSAVQKHVGSLLVVSDGMKQPALDVLRRRAAATGAEVLPLDTRNGKGSALALGLEHLLARRLPPEGVLVIDADGQHPPDAIPRFIAAARSAELVVGDRFGDLRSMPLLRRIANIVASLTVSVAARARVRDTQCGMRLLRGRALREIRFPGGGFEAETVHLRACLAAGVAVTWVPIPALYQGEQSAFRAVRDGSAVLRAATQRPRYFTSSG